VHLKCNMRPSKHFLRVFRALSFTHGCHWLAVLPGKDCTAALDCCWRAARMDGFQPCWPQAVPRGQPCLPFARGGRAGGNSDSSGRDEGISRGELLPTVASAVLTFLQARGTHTLPGSSTTGRHLHLPHRQQPLPQQPASNSYEQSNSSDASQDAWHEREKSPLPCC
jgi:hypothetical protein